jgi:hypothetical protein
MVSVVLSTMTCITVVNYRLPIGITLSVLNPVESVLNSIIQPVALLVLRKSAKDLGRHAVMVLHVFSTGFALRKLFVIGVALLSINTVLATLAFVNLSAQGCRLEAQWKSMFSQKSTQIKTIQTSVFPYY